MIYHGCICSAVWIMFHAKFCSFPPCFPFTAFYHVFLAFSRFTTFFCIFLYFPTLVSLVFCIVITRAQKNMCLKIENMYRKYAIKISKNLYKMYIKTNSLRVIRTLVCVNHECISLPVTQNICLQHSTVFLNKLSSTHWFFLVFGNARNESINDMKG